MVALRRSLTTTTLRQSRQTIEEATRPAPSGRPCGKLEKGGTCKNLMRRAARCRRLMGFVWRGVV